MAEVAERDPVYTADSEDLTKSQASSGIVAGIIATGC